MMPANAAATHDDTAAADAESQSPHVRTLLLTDLCGSTALVERIGDTAAADLFRAHDKLVLELQQRWRGRLIDRSDGLLLLFERPIDGLGFALDYNRGLLDLGKPRKLTLQARAGLHVGEVLTWRNSDVAVQFGAKPLEVEGLAKPMAGRLMTLARPGQILLSASAEPMAHRAASELAQRGEHLVWKHWGRWRFKGVPQPQEIYEVGEPGIAPLRAPEQNRNKAWRDIPLWRRPAALAAELLLVAGLVGGAWFMTRPQPAIAFAERDWVVVGDLRNLTGDSVLDDSLAQAFRISLEQSRFVNVVSDLKTRDTLERMRRKPGTALDRALASEVAIRDGARAVILPTVAEIGGRLRVSAEVIDPHTQTTVYAESADGSGVGSALGSIDKVTAALRGKLGEALESVQKTSISLPNVTTSNLDALKAYALGEQRLLAGDQKEAVAYFERAVALDPGFALANLRAAKTYINLGDYSKFQHYAALAARQKGRLPPREAMLLEVQLAIPGPVGPLLQQLRQVAELYPDEFNAQFEIAQQGMFLANRYASSLPHAKAGGKLQSQIRSSAIYLEGMLLLGLERYKDAIDAFQRSRESGYAGAGFSYAYAYAAQRDYIGAARALNTRRQTGVPTAELERIHSDMIIALDQGRWERAFDSTTTGLESANDAKSIITSAEWRNRMLSVEAISSKLDSAAIKTKLFDEISTLNADKRELDGIYPGVSNYLLLGAGYVGARIGSAEAIDKILSEVPASSVAGYPMLSQMRIVLTAEVERLRGKPERALSILSRVAQQDEASMPMHHALMYAAKTSGDFNLALNQARWLSQHRGRAYIEQGVDYLPTPFNIVDTTIAHLDTAELLVQMGDKESAKHELTAFLSIWPEAGLPPALAKRVSALAD